jgi:V/A-type H+-transporting ATPase subunit F
MKIRLLGDRLSLEMFAMVGITGENPVEAEEIERVIEKFMAEPDVGVVLITNSRAKRLGAKFRKYIERRRLPLVLRIPDRHDAEGQAGELREYLQRTLGIRL